MRHGLAHLETNFTCKLGGATINTHLKVDTSVDKHFISRRAVVSQSLAPSVCSTVFGEVSGFTRTGLCSFYFNFPNPIHLVLGKCHRFLNGQALSQ